MKIVAFFDMDDTLLRYNTGTQWGIYLKKRGDIGWMDLLKTMVWGIGYRLSLLDLDALMARLVDELKGLPEIILQEKMEDFVKIEVLKAVLPRAEEKLRFHRQQGHSLILLSSALSYMTLPVAAYLGFDDVLCTRLVVQEGQLTGACVMPICWGSGKVYYAEQYAQNYEIDLSQSFFYTDSYTDLPMLLRIGNPRVVNPDPRLRLYAKKKGWSVERW